MRISISFDPATDTLGNVLGVVTSAYPESDLTELAKVVQSAGSTYPALAAEHDPVAAAASFAEGTDSYGQQFAPSPEAAEAAMRIAQEQAGQPGSHAHTLSSVGHDQAGQHPGTSPAPSGTTIVLDKNGLPWDERIHSDVKDKMTKGGEWKKKRGVHDSVVQQVEAELRAKLAQMGDVSVAGAVNIPPGGVLGNQQQQPQQQVEQQHTQQQQIQQPQVHAQQHQNTAVNGPLTQQPGQPVGAPGGVSLPPTMDPASSFAAFMAYVMNNTHCPTNPGAVLQSHHLDWTARKLNLLDRDGQPEIALLDRYPNLLPHAKQWIDFYMSNPAVETPVITGLPGTGA